MGLIVFFLAWFATAAGLFVVPFGTGPWYLVAFVFCVLAGIMGMAGVAAQAMSDGANNFVYGLQWLIFGVLTVGGWGGAVYCLVLLVWRGMGMDVNVEVTPR